ncbi:DUF998 domain-containing protein [Nonomuraea sp. NBC_01738]|uniref:DUF998 domain-containing protein n=1 Tax=Nonomuraea sp. NBC_01738 TaxID=2976003 RepID=UPI002E1256E3|nr:DUF998 domain-containing protein [Nonomuraea sp. NBC_01738]
MTATTVTAGTISSARKLLICGAVATPLWGVVSLTQAATRTGFDLTQQPLSALANGDLGWLQIANFLIAGALTIAGATGLSRVMRGTPGGTWVPRLLRVNGAGMMAAGVLVMDPAAGWPAGTPEGIPTSMSWHSIGHMVAGSITFIAMIATCYVLARRLAKAGHRVQAVLSVLAGTALLVGDAWAMAGGAGGSLTLAVGYLTAAFWVTLFTARQL